MNVCDAEVTLAHPISASAAGNFVHVAVAVRRAVDRIWSRLRRRIGQPDGIRREERQELWHFQTARRSTPAQSRTWSSEPRFPDVLAVNRGVFPRFSDFFPLHGASLLLRGASLPVYGAVVRVYRTPV